MARFAASIQRLVPHERTTIFYDRAVTVLAFYFLVRAFQFKFGVTIMMEFFSLPVLWRVAALAKRPFFSNGFELTEVNIRVTVLT